MKNISDSNVSKKATKATEATSIIELIEQLRPYLNSDGGDIEFIKYEEQYVYVKLLGVCAECAFQDFTIQDNLYEAIKEIAPECKGIINVEL